MILAIYSNTIFYNFCDKQFEMSKIEQQTFYVRDKPDTKCHPDTSCAKHNKTWMKLKLLKQTKTVYLKATI